ncbi:hypothetical protein CASFOL_031342 [Castilleja foliolosa]|uniref:DUF7815 domain-containing protein n=1 Tax=Castilleja foliolosa TaxID=1961234 RepID=A0ABD3C510_9LAMI
MSQLPLELIRQVQICTRSATGISDYNPSDPTLPSLTPLSASIAVSDHSSPPQLRCKNCKGMLLRGSESFICVYCGLGPHYDVVPDHISFTSTIGYQWLLRSLGLDGSEMVDPTNKSEQNLGYNSPKSLTRLSDFLSFTIPWPAEIENQETGFPENQSEKSEGSSKLTGVALDKFFLKPNITSNEQPFTHNHNGASDGNKDVGYQDLFQNAQSSETNGTTFKPKPHEAFTGWQADFQAADSETQHDLTLVDSENSFEDPKSFDLDNNSGVILADHIDSVFGSGKDLNDGKKQEESLAVSSGFDDWNPDDVWNNVSSNNTTVSSSDIFQDFQSQTNYVNKSEKKPTNEEHKTVDVFQDFESQTNYVDKSEKKPTNEEHKTVDVFQDFQSQTNYADDSEKRPTNEEHKTMDEDFFDEWNDFTGSTGLEFPSKSTWTGSGDDYQVSTYDQKSSEVDLFSFDNKSEKGDFGSFSETDLFSTSISYSNATTDVNATMSENPASDRLFDDSGASHESGQAANDGNASEKSTEDNVKMLISQMHDLSFMLETKLCVPSDSDT